MLLLLWAKACALGIVRVLDDLADGRSARRPHAPGRFVVGLGGAHGPRPLQTMAAYLDQLGAVPALARVNGKPAQWQGTELRIRELPATVVIDE